MGYCLQLCSGLDGRNFRNERGLERGGKDCVVVLEKLE